MLCCPVVQLFLLAFPADKRLGIKAQTNCSEFTLAFCCTAQLALVILLLKVFCMAHRSRHALNTNLREDLSKLSSKVLKLRLQASIFQSRVLKGTYLAISSGLYRSKRMHHGESHKNICLSPKLVVGAQQNRPPSRRNHLEKQKTFHAGEMYHQAQSMSRKTAPCQTEPPCPRSRT